MNLKQIFVLTMVILWSHMAAISLLAAGLPSCKKYEGPIKPGMVITAQNWEQYLPELQKLLPASKIQWYGMGVKTGNIEMPIKKTNWAKLTNGVYEATEKYSPQCKIGPNNSMTGWTAGIPFPDPKSPIELAWNSNNEINRGNAHDDVIFFSWFGLFKGMKYEKHFKWELRKKHYVGRADTPPLGWLPEASKGGLCSKESMFVSAPHEVRGFIQLRVRYWAIDKMDDCYAYIPAIRRMRRLTGADVNDPILGSDCIFDDFQVWRQKLNPIMTFQVLECRDFLVPRVYFEKPPYDYHRQGPCSQVDWEIRPLWVVEVKTNDPNYIYSKRIIWIDKDTFTNYWGEQYDQRDRLWRANGPHPVSSDNLNCRGMFNWMYMNSQTNHYTMMYGAPVTIGLPEFEPLTKKAFTIKGLMRMSR